MGFVVVVEVLWPSQVWQVDHLRMVQPEALAPSNSTASALRNGGASWDAAASATRPGPKLILHIDDLNGTSRAMVFMQLVLLPQLVEHHQHHCCHEGNGYKAANDDLGGLHHII